MGTSALSDYIPMMLLGQALTSAIDRHRPCMADRSTRAGESVRLRNGEIWWIYDEILQYCGLLFLPDGRFGCESIVAEFGGADFVFPCRKNEMLKSGDSIVSFL